MSPSPSPGSMLPSSSKFSKTPEISEHMKMLKILDFSIQTLPQPLKEQPGLAILEQILSEIYFSGNWNRGWYNIEWDENNPDLDEYRAKQHVQQEFWDKPLSVFDGDDVFILLESQQKHNHEPLTYYNRPHFQNVPYPQPSQRQKRTCFPVKSFQHYVEQNPHFQATLDEITNDEKKFYARIRVRAHLLADLYQKITRFQTIERNEEMHALKRDFWYKLQFETGESNMGMVAQQNVPPYIIDENGWYGQSALAKRRDLSMPLMANKSLKGFYPKTARWDRILRGCYELDWYDENYMLDIIKLNAENTKYSQDFHVVLALRRERLFGEPSKKQWQFNARDFRPDAVDPFIHVYDISDCLGKVKMSKSKYWMATDSNINVWNRVRELYWTVNSMWHIANRFDPDGCLRVPALVNPIEWQYAITLKIVWDTIRVLHRIYSVVKCSKSHCGMPDGAKRHQQFVGKVLFAFDFNEQQIYDFRYIEYFLRHTLYEQLFHFVSKHLAKCQLKLLRRIKEEQDASYQAAKSGKSDSNSPSKKKKAGDDDDNDTEDLDDEFLYRDRYRFILDYFRFLIVCNNMYEFFSPHQMGDLWRFVGAVFEELRMIYPEVSVHTVYNEYHDMVEVNRHQTIVADSMHMKSYHFYVGSKYYTNNRETSIWNDARGVIKNYCAKNTLFPIPDIFERLYEAETLDHELNSDLTSNAATGSAKQSIYTDKDNANYRRKKLQKFMDGILYNMLRKPTAFFLTEIKYPFLCNLYKACVKYEMPKYIQSLLNSNITAAIQHTSMSYADMIRDNEVKLKPSPFKDAPLEDSQKRYVETRFPWSFCLFIEYLTFNPKQYHRERLCEIISKQKMLKADLEAARSARSGSKRRLLTCTNRLRLQKEKFDAWQKAETKNTIPIYPMAAMFRFACCERSNAKLADDDELLEEGTDFVISQAAINALSTIFKYPQFASRILLNTPKLWDIVDITYKAFKSIYQDIFRYDAKYQERPQMYELFKQTWIAYGKEVKFMLNVYHEEYQKLHREAVWKNKGIVDFQQLHESVYPKQPNALFTACTQAHFREIKEKYKLKIEDQEQLFLNDVLQVFKLFGYADDAKHKFYGNYYREFVEKEENEEEEEAHEEDEDDEHEEDAPKQNDGDNEEKKQEQEEEEEEEDEEDEEDEDEEEDEEDEKPRRNSTAAQDLPAQLMEDEDAEQAPPEETPEDEPKKRTHRKQDTLTQEMNAFAERHEFNVDQIEQNNVFQSKYDDSSDEELNVERPATQNNRLDLNPSADLDDFDDLDEENANKARGSNEFDADDVKNINEIKPGGTAGTDSPLQNIQENTNVEVHGDDEEDEDEEDHGNPFGAPDDEEDDTKHSKEDEETPPKQQEYQQQQQQGSGQNGFAPHGDDEDDGDDHRDDESHDDNAGQNGFGGGGGAGGAGGGASGGGRRDGGGDDDKDDKKKKPNKLDVRQEDEDEEEQDDDEQFDERQGTTPVVDVDEEQPDQEDEEDENGVFEEDDELKVNVGNTLRHMTKNKSKRHGFMIEDKDGDGDENEEEEEDDADADEFRVNKEWANTLLNNPNITGMQSREAMLQRMQEQQDLYQLHQNQRLQEDEQEDILSILEIDNNHFMDGFLVEPGQINEQHSAQQFGWQTANVLVPDLSNGDVEDVDDDVNAAEHNQVLEQDRFIDTSQAFSDETFFQIRNTRWNEVGRTDPISAIPRDVAENSYVMLKDLTEPLQLSDLLGDFQKAGQIMLSRIDDMQASLIVENKLHSGVLKAHQLDEKKSYEEKEELLADIEKLEAELKLLRDKRDENKAETAVLKSKQESYILKYNELKEVSTQKLRDQLRCFEIFKAQTTQLEKRIHSVEYQTEIAYKRYQRLMSFKKQQQLNIAQLDVEIESMEREKEYLQQQLANLEEEQAMIDENEKVYVERLKEQLRRLGKGMENKEKSCNIFRRNVVEERLRIHKIDDSLKKLRTNANPTTASDQELINATQHEALQAREKYAERTQQGSFFTNIHDHEKHLIESIEKCQSMDDRIYAKKWNIIQKSWNTRKTLLETANLNQMRKFLAKKEKQAKKHKKKLSKAQFRKMSSQNLSTGAAQQFRMKSQDFGNTSGY